MLKLYNMKTKETLCLPEWCRLNEPSAYFRSEYESRAFTHGSILTGDGKVEAREIILSGETDLFKSRAEHDNWYNTIAMHLSTGKNKLIVDDRYYYIIDMPSEISPTFEDFWDRRSSEIDITLVATDPFKYDLNITTQKYILESRDSFPDKPDFTINLNGIDAYPLWTITALEENVSSILLKNNSDMGRIMVYSDPQMTTAKQVVINSNSGEVTRTQDGRKALNFFQGTFLRLTPGINEIFYSGKKVELEIKWRNRRAF